MKISDILGELIRKAGINESFLSRKIDMPRATINRIISGKTPDPRASTLQSIARYFQVSVDQLLGNQPVIDENSQVLQLTDSVTVPIISWDKITDWKEMLEKFQPTDAFDWTLNQQFVEKGKFALRVKGEAMCPIFQESTMLVVDTKKEAKNKDYVVAYVKELDDILFRQLIVEGKYKFLKAINKIFPVVQLAENDRIAGVVTQTRQHYE